MKTSQVVVMVVVVCTLVELSRTGDAKSTGGQKASVNKLGGNYLLKLGRQYDKALLRLLGKTIANIEKDIKCASGGCDQWSEWSSCSVTHFGQFGMQERTRQCYLNMTTCERLASNKTEIDHKLCEGDKTETTSKGITCPENYNLTTHGFCLRFIQDSLTKFKAKEACQADGGYVVNVNSADKMDDIAEMTNHYQERKTRWMDGERTSVSAAWKFSYETDQTWSPKWADGDPDNGVRDLCLLVSIDKTKFDAFCGFDFPTVCEIVK